MLSKLYVIHYLVLLILYFFYAWAKLFYPHRLCILIETFGEGHAIQLWKVSLPYLTNGQCLVYHNFPVRRYGFSTIMLFDDMDTQTKRKSFVLKVFVS